MQNDYSRQILVAGVPRSTVFNFINFAFLNHYASRDLAITYLFCSLATFGSLGGVQFLPASVLSDVFNLGSVCDSCSQFLLFSS